MDRSFGRLFNAGLNIGTLFAGAGIGAAAILWWGSLQPKSLLGISTMDATAAVVEPFVIPLVVWVVGIGAGLFHAAALLKYLRRI